MIRRIRKMLGLQGQTIAEPVHSAAFAGDGAVQEIAGIELQTWLGGRDLHRATTRRLDDSRRKKQRVCRGAVPIQHPVVVVAVAVANLGVLPLVDSRSDCRRRAEVEWRALHGRDLARRYQRRVYWRSRIGVDGEHVSEDVARRVAGEI